MCVNSVNDVNQPSFKKSVDQPLVNTLRPSKACSEVRENMLFPEQGYPVLQKTKLCFKILFTSFLFIDTQQTLTGQLASTSMLPVPDFATIHPTPEFAGFGIHQPGIGAGRFNFS